MAESLKADIEAQLKAMLQLGHGQPCPKEEATGAKKKQRQRKKKKSPANGQFTNLNSSVNQDPRSLDDNPSGSALQKTPREKNVATNKQTPRSAGSMVSGETDSPFSSETGSPDSRDQSQSSRNSATPSTTANTPTKKGSSELKSEKLIPGLSQKVADELADSGIFPLKKKSTRFLRANFFCRVCEFHCDTVSDCRNHMKDRRHSRRLEVSKGDKQLKDIPAPSPAHIQALTKTVIDLVEKQGLSQDDMVQRKQVVADLEKHLDTVIPGVSLKLYGSSVTGFGMKSSDANVDIILPQGQSPSQALVTIYQTLKENELYTDPQSDFRAKIPSVGFFDPQSNTHYLLTVGNSQAQETTELLALYNKIDPRVGKLAVTFRFWAKVCKVDQQKLGTMPGYVSTLLTIYFLQQLDPPVLPVLHEYADSADNTPQVGQAKPAPSAENQHCRNLDFLRLFWHGKNTKTVGELWLEMLKFYSLDFSITQYVVCVRQLKLMKKGDKKWSGKKLAVEDPFSRKRNVTRSVSSNLVFDYIYDCIRKAYKYFGSVNNNNNSNQVAMVTLPLAESCNNKGSSTTAAPIIKLFPFNQTKNDDESGNIDDTNKNNNVEENSDIEDLQISSPNVNGSQWIPRKEMAENEISVLKNFAENLSNSIIDNVISSAQQHSRDLQPFEAKRLESENGDIENADSELKDCECSLNAGHSSISSTVKNTETLNKPREITPELLDQETLESFALSIVESVIKNALNQVLEIKNTCSANKNSPMKFPCDTESTVGLSATDKQSQEVKNQSGEVESTDCLNGLSFSFTAENLIDGKGPAIVCSICQVEGHLKQSCPEETLPDLLPLPKITQKHLDILNESLQLVPRDFAPTPQEVDDRNRIVSDLERFIRDEYPAARLSLFGSSCNGFGFRHSDLDICMTFNQPTAQGLDCVAIIEKLAFILKKHRSFYNILPITTAKVPILKFRHRPSNLEGDISLYNTLAQHNTEMLQMYSLIDRRVEILGYAMKVFAKVCEIGDASRGSLSSYGYILMVLHYLQQTKPAVIPVLQELHPPGESPEVMVDNWNAWFFRDKSQLPEVWPDYRRNKSSVAELWMGMFRYYTETFDFNEQVVCIRQLAPLSRFEKLWNGRCIAIEDPFDLSHNLGAGLSRKMNMYIQKAFIHGRELYCTPVTLLPIHYESWGDYFFDVEKLTEEAPPTDKCCRACGKIGHFVKECPIVRNRKQREEDERRRRRDSDRSQGDDRSYGGRREVRVPEHYENTNNSRGVKEESFRIQSQEFHRRPPQMTPSPRNSSQVMWQGHGAGRPPLMGSPIIPMQFQGGRVQANSHPHLNAHQLGRDAQGNHNPNWQQNATMNQAQSQQFNLFNHSQGNPHQLQNQQFWMQDLRNQNEAHMYKQRPGGQMYQPKPFNQQRGQAQTRQYIHQNERYDPRYVRKP